MATATALIDDRGRGPEIVGTRITIYNLLPHFLDPTATEEYLCRLYDLSADQVAAARAYVLNNADTVLARHLEIEARMAAGNPPEVIERAERFHATLVRFRDWLAEQREAEAREHAAGSTSGSDQAGSRPLPTFRQWLEEQASRPGEGS
jgi:uncharacterized protein (DUF433 family)